MLRERNISRSGAGAVGYRSYTLKGMIDQRDSNFQYGEGIEELMLNIGRFNQTSFKIYINSN